MALGAPSRPSLWNLPNQLTAARLLLSAVLFICIACHWWLTGAGVFAVAAATDWLDGYLARRQNLVSSLGRQLDPLVDKILICGAYIFLLSVPGSGLAAWMVAIVVIRELLITGLRGYLEQRGTEFGADWLGKLKMGLQCVALFAMLIILHWQEQLTDASEGILSKGLVYGMRDALLYGMVGVTAWSGLQYLGRAALLGKED